MGLFGSIRKFFGGKTDKGAVDTVTSDDHETYNSAQDKNVNKSNTRGSLRVSVRAEEFKVPESSKQDSSEEEDENITTFARRPEHNMSRGSKSGSAYQR